MTPEEHGNTAVIDSRPLRILVVEDNPLVADVAISLLTERGHAVTHVGTADEALTRLDMALARIAEDDMSCDMVEARQLRRRLEE